MAVYALWEMRNRVVFRDGEILVPIAAVIQRCSMLAAAPVSEVIVVPRPTPLLQATWARPPYGIYKLDFDAAVATTGEVGFGLIVRNMLGEVLASAAQYLLHAASAILGEALAFRWSMQLAIQMGFRRVLFETDCLRLFQLWKKPPDGRSYLSIIVGDCFMLSRSFDYVDLSFVRRGGNSVADILAGTASKYTDMVWLEEVPREVITLVHKDVMASMPAFD
ncbi:uncharacterized protein LOC130735910 [Lotus japonicus]|uniref:uncharacterized protein LOC130735910 n=1 Tax=Lotus japonicus TaxID=34305 RepID=UPI00258DEC3A|nr:uncharacterized protein LOC130735910 [Lotus japonicus]